MTSMSFELRRLRDAAALLSGGLSPRSRLITPLVPDHRYQMVQSRYLFASGFAEARSVVDVGCGSGFGAQPLIEAGATSYVGIEEYSRPLRHARRRYGSSKVQFREAPLNRPSEDLGQFGLVLCLDLLARYQDAETVLDRVAGHVDDSGRLIAGVPLATTKEAMERAFAAGAQTVLFPWYWASFFEELFNEVRFFRHRGPDAVLDWNEPSPSSFSAQDFRFEEEATAEALRSRPGLSAFFVCSRPKRIKEKS